MAKTTVKWLGVGLALFCSAALMASDAEPQGPARGTEVASGELRVANRSVIVFRHSVLGEPPALRATRAEAVINEVLESDTTGEVRLDRIQDSYLVLVGERRAFIVTPKDLDPAATDSVEQAAQAAAERLRLALGETHEARSLHLMLRAAGLSALATLFYLGLLRLLQAISQQLLGTLMPLVRRLTWSFRIGQVQLLDTQNVYPLVSRALWLLRWTLILLLSYQWLSFVLSQFPYTRPWGESLNAYLLGVARYLLAGVLGALPGLGIALAIFFVARGGVAFTRSMILRMAKPGTLGWLSPETLTPTTRLASLGIWLFALVMAYPYLPGSGTEAFKGLSVLIGLMISLGASSVVGQAAAGLILTYTRTMRPGEFVRIGDHEGTVTELGIFTTRIRTGLGEVLTLPNSMIASSVTTNYSRAVEGQGYVVDTVVTIGYDTPWRQVEAMLLEAASRTPGILASPTPQVFQTALSDFYPQYRLVAQARPSEPRPRAELLSMLHANIQDVFNEYGVQIMSPHYLSDPPEAKWVPRDGWYPAPANPPASAAGGDGSQHQGG